MQKDLVSLKKINKSFENKGVKKHLFNDLSFSVKKSEFVAIFGPNGCGKTTLLNMISGVDKEFMGTREANSNLKTAFVFQNYRESLFPWLNVEENISFPLSLKGLSRDDQNKAVKDLCNKLSVDINLNSYPYMLSGGQQQMVSILRALITNPDLLLMDEPFSALDYETNLYLLQKTQEIWKKTGVAIVFVSHEIDDAILLAERIVVLGRDPTGIVSEITNNLQYPREDSIMNSEHFHKIKNNVLSSFLKGYRREIIKN